jgi:two-component system response regulator PilR (NtrC family)
MPQYKVLVVDDEQDIRECMELLVKDKQITFTLAEDGQAGLDLLLKEKFDCIVSDIKMPRMDGITMLKKMRAAHIHTPIIFISGFASEDFAHDVSVYGAAKMIHKLELTQIKMHILEAIKSSGEINALEASGDDAASDFLNLVNKTK